MPDPPAGNTVFAADHIAGNAGSPDAAGNGCDGTDGTDTSAGGGAGHDGPACAGNPTNTPPTTTPHNAAANTRRPPGATPRQPPNWRRPNPDNNPDNDTDAGMTPPLRAAPAPPGPAARNLRPEINPAQESTSINHPAPHRQAAQHHQPNTHRPAQ
ncbi:hypothetical protein GCM10010199_46530 [Dactylosporangium roseum]